MALLIKKGITSYLYVERELVDPRTQDWFLVGNTWTVLFLIAGYNYVVLDLGPKLMKDRKPFDLTNILIVYNAIQIAMNVHIFREALFGGYLNGYNPFCEPVDYSTSPDAIRIARGVWFFYMVKISDLLDTIFFVLRKKKSQVSFLHVYHHSGMVFTGHMASKYLAGGHSIFVGFINSIVHIAMYSYYLVTAWKPELKGSLWWKKHITQLQIIQFTLISIQISFPLIIPNCGYPVFVTFALLPQNFFMMVLFADFYRKAYWNKGTQKQDIQRQREHQHKSSEADSDATTIPSHPQTGTGTGSGTGTGATSEQPSKSPTNCNGTSASVHSS